MHTLQKALLGTGVLAVLALAWTGCGKQAGAENPGASEAGTISTPPRASSVAVAPPLTVNSLAKGAAAHLGHVTVIGVVEAVSPGKSFVLVDTHEFKECGLSSMTEADTKKIPVRWTGATPKVTDAVRVEGTLAKSKKGLIFTADKIGKP